MPTYGICAPLDQSAAARDAGWDYLEGSTQALFQGDASDADWTGEALVKASALPVLATNVFLPGDLKVVGPTIDEARVERYLSRVFPRARACGTDTIVFGSGVARMVPEGFDRARAEAQVVAFAARAARHAAANGVTLVFEPLNLSECNIGNTVGEGVRYVRAAGEPAFLCLVDSYHFWRDQNSLDELAASMAAIAHVHVADEHGRDAPGFAETPSDYRAFFGVLKAGGYDGRISVESPKMTPERFGRALEFLKREWAAA